MSFSKKKVNGVSEIIDAVIDLIKKNLIAKTNITQDVNVGDTIISIENAFKFRAGDEIVLIDYGYNVEGHIHYQIFEYAKIKKINSTKSIELEIPTEGQWLLSDNSFIQKTIGHSPLYEDKVYYGDRSVIPIDQMAITVEPLSMKNEWMYIQGGLNKEYSAQITVYGKEIDMENGKRILDMYCDNVEKLLNDNLHLDIDGVTVPILQNVSLGANVVVIEDTPENRENFSSTASEYESGGYELQDNLKATYGWFNIISQSYSGGKIYLTLNRGAPSTFSVSEFAYIRKVGRYIWDSRATNITYGVIQKKSGLLRAGQIEWFGKWVDDIVFPQPSKKV